MSLMTLLNPRMTWENKDNYDEKAQFLANKFNENFKKFKEYASDEILNASPRISIGV